MQSALRKIGNSTGFVVPRPILDAMAVSGGTVLDLKVEGGSLIATPVVKKVREGWAEDAKRIAAEGLTEEEADWLAFGNDGDDDLTW